VMNSSVQCNDNRPNFLYKHYILWEEWDILGILLDHGTWLNNIS
jgi:hypothetical protein